ncbi:MULTISPECIES: thiamine pyrophosphate-binding protein [unclassified Achromobacter]|uniref:thiamine pyrophosphate-binding protein n=1 Tax=unclassified Achromobacter TaxID=2626865 RepID=UPI000B518EA9|nr:MULTISPECIES: thiamine pyrophosphate-binding protein [unclassified Achromobacter]OWT80697.1 thiamine pyrophosphate-binding protein [Achromobacter sp. HZ34]OWT81213.1 thiamine pyrophosphate-binding protein [Achromobacter sp. HZ28]
MTSATSIQVPQARPRNGGQILVEQLIIQGVKRVFLVPGESYLPCIDALYDHQDAIQPVVCRQESGAGYMAEAYGKLTGEPGICFVTRGPGATNASIAVHTAHQDSTPLILFIGQVGNDFVEREAFQEVDYRRMFGEMAKWVAQIDRTDRIPEYIARAFATATSGRPGPVVLALPEDTLWGNACVADVPRYQRARSAPTPAAMTQLAQLLDTAQRPFLLLGGSGWTPEAAKSMEALAERYDLPVGVAWRRLECFDNRHPNFAGHVGWGMPEALRRRALASDLLIAVGTRMGEATTEGYSLIESPVPRQRLVHVYPDANELGRVFHPTLPIAADVNAFASAAEALHPKSPKASRNSAHEAHAAYLAEQAPKEAPGALNLNKVACHVRDHAPADTCITVGAGNYALFPHAYHRYSGVGTSLAPTVGSMGYGLPAAISAKLEQPARTVICFAGDGCFQMNIQELGVAMQYRVGIVILVFNNGIWGTIRAHQEREFPGRTIALGFDNPEFTELIRAYKGYGEIVDKDADFGPAFARALAYADEKQLPALLELRYDADGIAPGMTLSKIQADAYARQRQA